MSEHFTLVEFTRSATAMDKGIDNTPSLTVVYRLQQLCLSVLEPLRKRFGVIRVTSGYRCEALNKAVGGVSNSQHVTGEAADIHVTGMEEAKKLAAYIEQSTDFDQLIYEPRGNGNTRKAPRWLHVSYKASGKNRKQVLR